MVPKATKGYFLNTYLVILQGSLSNGKFKGFGFITVYHYSIPLYSPDSGWFVSLYHYSRKTSFLHLPSHPRKSQKIVYIISQSMIRIILYIYISIVYPIQHASLWDILSPSQKYKFTKWNVCIPIYIYILWGKTETI